MQSIAVSYSSSKPFIITKKIQMLMSQLPPFRNSYANLDVDTLASGISGIRIFAG